MQTQILTGPGPRQECNRLVGDVANWSMSKLKRVLPPIIAMWERKPNFAISLTFSGKPENADVLRL